jgi:hypothetical protein
VTVVELHTAVDVTLDWANLTVPARRFLAGLKCGELAWFRGDPEQGLPT